MCWHHDDVSVNVSKFRVLEGLGEGPDNGEFQLLPESDSALGGADNNVELNGHLFTKL